MGDEPTTEKSEPTAPDDTTTAAPAGGEALPSAPAPEAAATPPTPPVASAADSGDPVVAKLVEVGVDSALAETVKDALGANTLDDLVGLTDEDYRGAGVKPAQLRKLMAEFGNGILPAFSGDPGAPIVSTLPTVPNFESLLGMLKTGGVLRVEESTVIAGVQGWLAERSGLFDLPAKLAKAIYDRAIADEFPVDPAYRRLKRLTTRRSYGDLFAAIEDFDGRSVTKEARDQLYLGVGTYIVSAGAEFNAALETWLDLWDRSSNKPGAMMRMLASGGRGPRIGMTAPDTGGLRDQADKFTDAINKAFAGEGVQVAAAVAYDAAQVRTALMDGRLPALVGAANREQMLKQLGVAVSAAEPRLELNLTQFVLAVMQLKNVPGGQAEEDYLQDLYALGAQVDWGALGYGSSDDGFTTIGGKTTLRQTTRLGDDWAP